MAGLHFPSAPHIVVNVALLSLAELSAKICPAAHDTCTTDPMKLSVEFKTCENDIGWQVIATKRGDNIRLKQTIIDVHELMKDSQAKRL